VLPNSVIFDDGVPYDAVRSMQSVKFVLTRCSVSLRVTDVIKMGLFTSPATYVARTYTRLAWCVGLRCRHIPPCITVEISGIMHGCIIPGQDTFLRLMTSALEVHTLDAFLVHISLSAMIASLPALTTTAAAFWCKTTSGSEGRVTFHINKKAIGKPTIV
jgi:hypothetical protein